MAALILIILVVWVLPLCVAGPAWSMLIADAGAPAVAAIVFAGGVFAAGIAILSMTRASRPGLPVARVRRLKGGLV